MYLHLCASDVPTSRAAGSYGHAHAPNGPPQIPESLNRAGNLDGDNCDAPETNHWMLPSPSDAETTLDAKQTHQQMDKKCIFLRLTMLQCWHDELRASKNVLRTSETVPSNICFVSSPFFISSRILSPVPFGNPIIFPTSFCPPPRHNI